MPVPTTVRSSTNRSSTTRWSTTRWSTTGSGGPSPGPELTPAQARRIAIAAQQLAGPPRLHDAAAVNRGHLMRLVRSIGLLQIDSVNVLARAHLLPIFSRLGSYPVSVLDGAAWPRASRDRLLVEAWAHVASLIPLAVQPLVRWRQEQFATEPWGRVDALRRNHPGFLDTVLAVIAEQGPSSAGDIERALEAPGRETSGWWEWSITKTACEYLFAVGAIGVASRRGFERCYDLVDRVLPPEILATPTPAVQDAKRALMALAARSHGIGTVADLADYYRVSVRSARVALAELVEDGEVTRAGVRGWKEPAFLHRDARIPRRVNGSALLCPFDPLIWARERTERLFGTRYRIEIYVPAAQRQYGYYVLPLLVGERIVGRFDLKADRATGRLLVQAAWSEGGSGQGSGRGWGQRTVPVPAQESGWAADHQPDPAAAADAAAVELARMAGWLGLGETVVLPRGDLWRTLAARPGMRAGSAAEAGAVDRAATESSVPDGGTTTGSLPG